MKNFWKSLAILLIGVGVGAFLFRGKAPFPEQDPAAPASRTEALQQEQPAITEDVARPPVEVKGNAADQSFRVTSGQAVTAPNLEPRADQQPAPEEQDVRLSLSDADIAELERREIELRPKLRVSRSHEGWRVEILSRDALLDRIGLRNGDLISPEAIGAQLENPETRMLAWRMKSVLDRLSQ